jgi:hypothetical protein
MRRWLGHVASVGEITDAHKIFDWRPEGMRPLWRPRSRRENYFKMGLKEIKCEVMGLIHSAQDRLSGEFL